jgi:hypothetical protein
MYFRLFGAIIPARTSDLQPANQAQISANHMICKVPFSMFFDTLICTDLQLICTPQITANQAPSASK